jgi:DNA-binding transcriptional LysR family regulator
MRMIDPRLQTLRVLAVQGSVTATAQALHLAPSTVSQQLRQLAGSLGVELLEPEGRRVKLTPAARTLLRHADLLHAQAERASADLAAHRKGTAGQLRISSIASALISLVLPAAERLRDRYPQLSLDIREDAKDDRYQLLLTGQVDIAVVIPTADGPPADDERFAQQTLLEEPLDLLVPADHRFARQNTGMELTEAADETWIRAGDPADQHQLLLAACAAAGFTPRICGNAIDWFAIAALVQHGVGIALIPRLAPIPTGYQVVRIPLHGTTAPTRRLVTCVRRGSQDQRPIANGLAALRVASRQQR